MAVIALLPLAYIVLYVVGVITFVYATDLVLRYKAPVGNTTEGSDGVEDEVVVPLPRQPTIVEKYLYEELHPVSVPSDFYSRSDRQHEEFLRALESGLEEIDGGMQSDDDRDAAEDIPAKPAEEEEMAVVGEESRPQEEGADVHVPPPGPPVLPPPPLPGLCGGYWPTRTGPTIYRSPKHRATGRLDGSRTHKKVRLLLVPAPPPTSYVPTVLPLPKDHPCRRRLPARKATSILEETLRPLIECERRVENILDLKQVEAPTLPPATPPPSQILEGFLGFLRGDIQGGLTRVEELERLLAENKARVAELDSMWEDTSSEISPEDEATLPVVLADGINAVWVESTRSLFDRVGPKAPSTRT
ncbi:hypothetical protein TWF281_007477 [Arthrobotrys megalospora]